MRAKQPDRTKMPIIKIDKRLNELEKTEQFPEKLAKANRILKSTPLPASFLRSAPKLRRSKARKPATTNPA